MIKVIQQVPAIKGVWLNILHLLALINVFIPVPCRYGTGT